MSALLNPRVIEQEIARIRGEGIQSLFRGDKDKSFHARGDQAGGSHTAGGAGPG